MQQSKCCALPLGDSPLKSRVRESVRHIDSCCADLGPHRAPFSRRIKGWVEGLEPSISRTTIWRVNQLRHTHHMRKTAICPASGRLCASFDSVMRSDWESASSHQMFHPGRLCARRIRRQIHHRQRMRQAVHVPVGIRTPDPRLRRPMLYPAELRTRISG